MPGERIDEEVVARMTDLHFALLEHLPVEGSKLGYHPLFKTTKMLVTELNSAMPDAPPLAAAELPGHLRSMTHIGLVKTINALNDGRVLGWQKTKLGESVMRTRRGEADGSHRQS